MMSSTHGFCYGCGGDHACVPEDVASGGVGDGEGRVRGEPAACDEALRVFEEGRGTKCKAWHYCFFFEMTMVRSLDVPRKIEVEGKGGKVGKGKGKVEWGKKGKMGEGKKGKKVMEWGNKKNLGKKGAEGEKKRFRKGKNRDLEIKFDEDARL
jgi:hypothetical protein